MTDATLNPITLAVSGAEVATANPLPAHEILSAGSGTPATINPQTWTVSGAVVTPDNPLPIQLV